MKPLFWLAILTLLLNPCQLLAQTPEEKGLAIAKQAEETNKDFGDYTAEMKMVLISPHGDTLIRKMRGRFLEVKTDGDKSLLIFDNPRDVKGTAMLTHSHKNASNEQWLYLPALRRTKRISSSGKAGAFMASEFSYEDLTSQDMEKFHFKWLRDEKYNNQPCHVLERIPTDPDSGYTKEIIWLDQAELRSWKIDFYDRKHSKLKTLTSSKFKKYKNKYWRAEIALMTNHQNNKKTKMIWKNFKFKTGLSDRDFEKNVLKRLH